MIEPDQSTFEQAVLERSRTLPVLVDFWAPWCGPCRAVGPVLERLQASFEGRFELAKINVDTHPELATRYDVRSIPYGILFIDGKPVDSFIGALSESALREFLERVVPGPAEVERRRAHGHLEHGELDAAAAALRAAIALDPESATAQLDLADLLLEQMPEPVDDARLAEATQALTVAQRLHPSDERCRALEARLSSLRSAATLPTVDVLRARVTAHPEDLEARWALAQHHLAHRELEPTLAALIEIIERDRRFRDDGARKLMLSVLDLAAAEPELVSRYRRRLAAVLHR